MVKGALLHHKRASFAMLFVIIW